MDKKLDFHLLIIQDLIDANDEKMKKRDSEFTKMKSEFTKIKEI